MVTLGRVREGGYGLDGGLGKGGMGVVYRAEHVALRRTVAVKLLHPSLAAATDLRTRFEREAIAIGRIDHPNCVAVTDFGKLEDGSLFLVMELVRGTTLRHLLDHRQVGEDVGLLERTGEPATAAFACREAGDVAPLVLDAAGIGLTAKAQGQHAEEHH